MAGTGRGIFASMGETFAGIGAGYTASNARGTDGDQGLENFPLLRTRFAEKLFSRLPMARFLVSGSPAFRLLMLGSSISMLGTRISTVAFPLLVLNLNKSPLVAGLVAFAAIAPSMLVYVPAGVLVDRWNPRRVMLVSEFSRGLAIASVVIALVIYGNHIDIWLLIVAMVAEEILEIFSTLADRRYLSKMIGNDEDEIVSRQASVEIRTHAAVLAGRPIGPFLFTIDPLLPFLADALSFIASVSSLLLIRTGDEPQRERENLRLRTVIGDLGQGAAWLKKDRRAWLTIVLMAMTSMVAQALILMFLVLAHSSQMSTIEIGVVLAASGAGGAIGSFCPRIVPAVVRGFWLPVQMIAWSVALAYLALAAGQSAYLSAAAMFVLGFTGAIGNIEFGTYLAAHVKDEMMAKVTGIGQMLAIGAGALGPVLGGYAIEELGIHGAVGILFAMVVVLLCASCMLPEVNERIGRRLLAIKKSVVRGRRPSIQ